MIRTAVRAILATVVLAVLTGLVYPLVITGIGQAAFGHRANGSMVVVNGQDVGSSLIGQQWKGPQWFYGRPSAINYDASTSSGTNLGPHSRPLRNDIREREVAILRLEGRYTQGLTVADIPPDLLTASGSGLDPDITPEAARFQAPRIAAVRGYPLSTVMGLIQRNTSGAALGVFGMPRVNVLELNVALQSARP
jgi:potassium-transporting ATPase KdpC subunit